MFGLGVIEVLVLIVVLFLVAAVIASLGGKRK